MMHTHPHHQLQLAHQRQAEFLEQAQANALARQLRPQRPKAVESLAEFVARKLEQRRRAVAVPRTSQA